MNELDEILLDQLHLAKRNKKKILKLIRAMPHEKDLKIGVGVIDKRIEFLEMMIVDKTLLKTKHKRKKCKDPDILTRNPVFTWYRFAYIASTVYFKMIADYTKN